MHHNEPTHTFRIFICFFCLVIITTCTMASITELETTILTGSQEHNNLSINSITSDQISTQNPADLSDIFSQSPGITVNGGRVQAQQLFLNNLESTLLNVTIDGASQANLYHHQSSVLIEPEMIKQVYVSSGAGTALDGPGALGGTIKFTTKNAFDFSADSEDFGGKSKGTYFSNGEGYKLSQTFHGLFNDHWGILFNGLYTDRDEYEDGNGDTVALTDFTRENFLVKISRQDNLEGIYFNLGIESLEDETVSFDRVNISEDFLLATGRPTGLLQQLDSTRLSLSADLDITPEGHDNLSIETNIFFNDQAFERKESKEEAKISTFGLDIRNTSTISNMKLTYGLDYQVKEGESSYIYGYAPGATEEECILGLYLQDVISLSDDLSVSLGARFDRYDYDNVADQNFESDQVSPNVSIIWKPINKLTIDAGYSEAYRGVGIREIFLTGARPEDLDGEEAKTLKLNLQYTDELFFLKASVFDQTINNYIYPFALRPFGSFGDIESDGYEMMVGLKLDRFTLSAGVSHAKPEVDGYEYTDDYGMVAAGRKWVTNLKCQINESINLSYSGEFRESVDEEPNPGPFPNIAAKDAYDLHQVTLNWSPESLTGLHVSLVIDNLFDEAYQDHTIYTSSGLMSPGREARVALSYHY